ncbi:isoaspartyl peptidase/L-asparaginase family protein [Phenylobacterium sp.]|jgi:beta-aspartyl-peptidase (threonine type)|uniref:isoaspartyl peptidase/L-asparaginase family protein n=1 Tax=Phenylobacterium sp. TaxID=1871053 RepID=UPI002F95F0C9
MAGQWAVVVHGGCKPIRPEEVEANRRGISAAVRAAAEALRSGGSALDAVEAAVRSMEDDPIFNAGHGAVGKADGRVEMDASIMDGETLDIGAVCALQKVANPVSIARALLGQEEVLLAGEGAQQFALAQGVELADIPPRPDPHAAGCDTVGCVALDSNGAIAAATSTGGLKGAPVGRIGDSPLPGCGFYADSRVGGISATGEGERIARTTLAARVIQALEDGAEPQAAVEAALKRLDRVSGEAGLIALDPQGRIGWAFNATQFAVGWASAGAEARVEIAGLEGAGGGGSRLS